MCGRYRLSRRKQFIAEHFDAVFDIEDWTPRYNLAPTQQVLVVRQHPTERTRHLSQIRWGLIPSWSKDASGAARMINARSETAHELPAFRDAMRYRRCLVPADGFYEWKRSANGKQPYCFEVRDGELFAFAGLWEGWKDTNGAWTKTCTILTTTPNVVTAALHDRMPVILHRSDYGLWLDPDLKDPAAISELLKPFNANAMRCYPVSGRVNNVENDDPGCAAPISLGTTPQGRLFA